MRGRRLFGEHATYEELEKRFESGAVIKSTKLTKEFDYKCFQTLYGDSALLLFVIGSAGLVTVNTVDQRVTPIPGNTLISLVDSGGGENTSDAEPNET